MSALNKSSRTSSVKINQEFETFKREIFPRLSMLEQRIIELEGELQEQKAQKCEMESKIESLSPDHVEELRGSVYRLGRVVARMRSSL